jgi:hypothetical protein
VRALYVTPHRPTRTPERLPPASRAALSDDVVVLLLVDGYGTFQGLKS